MVENRLLILPIFKSSSIFRKIGYKKIIQNSPFVYGVKIKNIGKNIFTGGKLENIKINPLNKNIDLLITCDKKFDIPELGSGDISIIWFGKTSLNISGQFWLDFKIRNKDIENKIFTYQFGENEKFSINNEWGDLFLIKDEHLFQQELTNILLITFTILTTVLSIIQLAKN